mgnify:CR=1 FL=1
MRISSLRWGILLLCIGLTFLANNLGYLDFNVWGSIITLWPVLIIAVGIEIIFRRTKLWFLSLASPLLIAAAFVYGVMAADRYGDRYPFLSRRDDFGRRTKQFEFDRDDSLKKLNLDIDCAAGDFWLGSNTSCLFEADFEFYGREPKCRLKKSGDEATITVESGKPGRIRFFKTSKSAGDARLFVADWLPLQISLNSAASTIEMDLRELLLTDLDINTGASSIVLRFGQKSNKVSAKIESGASSVRLFIPREAGIMIDHDGALSSSNFADAGLKKIEGRYKSDNYETAECRIELNIDSGVSSIELDYY